MDARALFQLFRDHDIILRLFHVYVYVYDTFYVDA